MNQIDQIITTINAIESVDDEENLRRLDQALQDLFTSPQPERGIDALFRIYERFPESDGYGVFWSILHGLERLPNYEPRLITSVQRQPMEFNLTMVNRLLNAGTTQIEGTNLVALLEAIAASPQYPEQARGHARRLVERQKNRSWSSSRQERDKSHWFNASAVRRPTCACSPTASRARSLAF